MRILKLALLAVFLTACASQQAKYYTLTAVPPNHVKKTVIKNPPFVLGVGPISIPEYLQRPQIVLKAGHNQLLQCEFQRWAESLESNTQAVIVKNLELRHKKWVFIDYPWQLAAKVNKQLKMKITSFETTTGGSSILGITWSVSNPKTGKTYVEQRRRYTTHVSDMKNISSIVSAMSVNLGKASRDMSHDVSVFGRHQK